MVAATDVSTLKEVMNVLALPGIKHRPIRKHVKVNSLGVNLKKNLQSWFPTRSDKNQPVQSQKHARSLEFRI